MQADKKRVVLIEDEAIEATRLQGALRRAGYEVERATEESLPSVLKTFAPQIVYVDMVSPRVRGVKILRLIKSNPATKEIAVVICSLTTLSVDIESLRSQGCFHVLNKPFEVSVLLRVFNKFFALYSGTEGVNSDHYVPELSSQHGTYRLWGTRGSIPISGPSSVRHGGNTSCMSMTVGDETLIFDAGSGIRCLGLELAQEEPRPLHLFITHTHWDHIQGFPFFMPAFLPGFEIHVYGAKRFASSLEDNFRGQLQQEYFPIQMDDMQADLHFHHLEDACLMIHGCHVCWHEVNHPGHTVCYRVTVGEKNIVWLPDQEFLQGYLGAPDEIDIDHERIKAHLELIEFLKDTDVLITEAQYTNEEYSGKIAWGHTCVSNACVLMKLANIQR